MSKKDKIIGNCLKACLATGPILIYLIQRKIIKEQDEIIKERSEMLDKALEQQDELIDICSDLLGYDEEEKQRLIAKAGFTVVK